MLPRPRWVLETRLRTLAPTVSEIGALGGNRTRTSALATRCSATKLRTHRKIVGQEHNAAMCGTQLLALCSCPVHNKERTPSPRRIAGVATGLSRWTFRCFGHTSHEALKLLLEAWESFDQGRTVRRVGRQSLDTPALGRLTFRKVAPQRPLKSPVVVTDSRRAASYSWWRGILFALNSHLTFIFLLFFFNSANKKPCVLFRSRVLQKCFERLPASGFLHVCVGMNCN